MQGFLLPEIPQIRIAKIRLASCLHRHITKDTAAPLQAQPWPSSRGNLMYAPLTRPALSAPTCKITLLAARTRFATLFSLHFPTPQVLSCLTGRQAKREWWITVSNFLFSFPWERFYNLKTDLPHGRVLSYIPKGRSAKLTLVYSGSPSSSKMINF